MLCDRGYDIICVIAFIDDFTVCEAGKELSADPTDTVNAPGEWNAFAVCGFIDCQVSDYTFGIV